MRWSCRVSYEGLWGYSRCGGRLRAVVGVKEVNESISLFERGYKHSSHLDLYIFEQ